MKLIALFWIDSNFNTERYFFDTLRRVVDLCFRDLGNAIFQPYNVRQHANIMECIYNESKLQVFQLFIESI